MKQVQAITALFREIANFSLPSLPPRFHILGWTPPAPSFGSVLLLVANTILLLVLGFYKLDPSDYDNLQNIAYRWGFLTLGQIPLLFLLAGKTSIIGFFTHHSYERLNWLHRWVARCMLLTATLHMGFWFGDWAPYDYIGYQIKNDKSFTQTGFAAWFILLWIVLSSMAPIRNLSYEFFFVQHLVSFIAFLTMVFIHTPVSDHGWLWVPVGLYIFDRVVRTGVLLGKNLLIFNPRKRRPDQVSSVFVHEAQLRPIAGDMVRVTVQNPNIKWEPGQHVLLSLQKVLPLQQHPFTVASIPSDGKMEFIIQARRGGTRRLLEWTKQRYQLPTHRADGQYQTIVPCTVSNPYGQLRPLRQFDSVVLLSGSTGATFTVPLMRDIVERWTNEADSLSRNYNSTKRFHDPVTRRVRFVWVVKSGEHISWFAEQLRDAFVSVEAARKQGLDVRLQMSIYVTCDETFTSDSREMRQTRRVEAASHSKPSPVETSELNESVNIPIATKLTEKTLDVPGQTFAVNEVDPRSESVSTSHTSEKASFQACGPDGICCCQMTITDESTAPAISCTCNCDARQVSIATASTIPATDPVKELMSQVNVLAGRPHLSNIIRKTLETARGETAVVACGPHSMNNDVRRAVVRLSDERAVGRATGALGVWFWGEGFGW